MNKRILLRAPGLLPPRKGSYRQGIGRANYELLNSIKNINTEDIDLSFYCNQISTPFYTFPEWDFGHYMNILPDRLNDICSLEASWRKYCTKYDLFHITDNYAQVRDGERFVVTIHDLKLYEEKPRVRSLFQKMSKDSLGIVTCSQYTKEEIIRILGTDSGKINVIPWGINHAIFNPQPLEKIEALKKKYHFKSDYFFACSCSHPRKNAGDILKAFRMYKQEGGSAILILTWGNVPQYVLNEYHTEIDKKSLFILEYVTDEELAVFYSGALASFLVSSLEGFGFPVLESMACGTNCITCRNSSLIEIGGEFAIFVEEHNIEEIAEKMLRITQSGKGDTDKLIRYASSFTWEKTAMSYIDFYRRFI